MSQVILKRITFMGIPAAVACDARCDKAWGRSSRPRQQLSDDEDDFEWLGDDELGTAPADPGTCEGSDSKPALPVLNRWCVRECERCAMTPPDGSQVTLLDWSKRVKNNS